MPPGLMEEKSMIRRDKWIPSVFRPPKFSISLVPPKKTLAATAQPWYPGMQSDQRGAAVSKTSPSRPQAPDLLPNNNKPKGDSHLAPAQRTVSHGDERAPFSPLARAVKCLFHTFTDEATEKRVYPVNMFLSVRKDTSHTPYGVLKWCVQQYLEGSLLKLPAHLQLSMTEVLVPGDAVTRGVFGSSSKQKIRPNFVRHTKHKVMSILSRVTPSKYKELLQELLELPLRQSGDAELHDIVKVFFEKAVQEPEYSELYAQLLEQVCTMREDERKLEVELWDGLLCNRMRRLLIAACEEELRRSASLTPDEQVDRTTGKPLNEEELEMKCTRIKKRLIGNIKFVGELFKISLITEDIIVNILRLLMFNYSISNPQSKEDYVFEIFAMLIKTVAPLFGKCNPQVLSQYLGIAKSVELTHPRARIRFLMMDLIDLNTKKGWVSNQSVLRDSQNFENAYSLKVSLDMVQSSVTSTGVTTPTEKNFTCKDSSADLTAPACVTPRISLSDPLPAVANPNDTSLRDVAGRTPDLAASGGDHIVQNPSPVGLNLVGPYAVSNSSPNNFTPKSRRPSTQTPQMIHTTRERNSFPDSPPAVSNATQGSNKKDSTSSLLMTQTPEVSSTTLSEGARTPILYSMRSSFEKIKVCEVVDHLIEKFNSPEEEANVLQHFSKISFRSKVLCLTWWLRKVTTNTCLFYERERVTNLLSSLLLSCPSFDPKHIFLVIVEWIRFDIEKALFRDCPRMFDNIAQMILYSYSPEASKLPNIDHVHELLHSGIFNIIFHELIAWQHRDQLLTLLKCVHPVCTSILSSPGAEPRNPTDIFRIAVQNRFHMMLCFLSAINGSERDSRKDAWHRCCGSNILGTTLKPKNWTTGEEIILPLDHFDPLTRLLSYHPFSNDTELLLFRSIATEPPTQWRQQAIKSALSTPHPSSLVSQLIEFMKVIGILLNSANLLAQKGNVNPVFESVMADILSFRKGTLFEAAAVIELILHLTRSRPGRMEPKCTVERRKTLQQIFGRWCGQGLIQEGAVKSMLQSLSVTQPGSVRVFTNYFDSIVDEGMSWSNIINCLIDK